VRAHLLYALGHPKEVVAEGFRQRWVRLNPASARDEEETHDKALLAAAYGDFDAAKAHAEEGLRQANAQPTLRAQARFARLLVDIELEVGRATAAAAVAGDYLKRREAWQLGLPAEDPAVYFARVAARREAEDEVRARRDAWVQAAAPTTPAQRAEVWALAYALGVERADEAAEALAARPADARWSILVGPVDAALGQALWLGGQRDEAMPHLTRAFTRCDRFPAIFQMTRASLLYGRALEALGDRSRACEVYRALVTRWGEARPRSLTAAEAGRRATTLGCGAAGR
jgi:serine/threonine-protein kinase